MHNIDGVAHYIFKGHRSEFLNCDAFLSLKIVLTPANSEGTDEMPHVLPGSLLGLYYMPKYPFTGFQTIKG